MGPGQECRRKSTKSPFQTQGDREQTHGVHRQSCPGSVLIQQLCGKVSTKADDLLKVPQLVTEPRASRKQGQTQVIRVLGEVSDVETIFLLAVFKDWGLNSGPCKC